MILPRALWKLMGMRYRSRVRRLFSLRSPARFVLTVLGALAVTAWLGSVFVMMWAAGTKPHPEFAVAVVPMMMLGFLVLALTTGNTEMALAFAPAEVDFLFPGPFTRRQLVTYRLVKVVIGSLTASVFFLMFMRGYAAHFWQAYAGAVVMILFINLSATLVALAQRTVAERMVRGARRALLVVVIGGVAYGVWSVTRGPGWSVMDIARSPVVAGLAAPLRPFAMVMAAGSAAESLAWLAACLGMCGLVLAGVYALDAQYAEAAVAASRRLETRLRRMRAGSVATTFGEKSVRSRSAPLLGEMGAFGAVLRRQLLAAMRGTRVWIVALIAAGGYAWAMSRFGRGPAGAAPLAPAGAMVVMMLPALLKFDFRSDLDQIEYLKTLPTRAATVAGAQLAVPVAMLTLVEIVVLAVTGWWRQAADTAPWALGLAVPVNVLLVGVENLAFLLWPSRMAAPGQGGMALSGRRMMMLLGRVLLLVTGAGAVAGAYGGVWALTRSHAAAGGAGVGAAFALAGVVVWGVAKAFERFDVSRDMPE